MGCCSGLGRVIVILNLIFFLVGLALTVVGALIMAGGDTLIGLLKQAGVNNADNFSTVDIKQFVGGLDLYILIMGIIFLVFATCGIICACCKFKYLLIINAILVGLILAAEIAILIIIFANRALFDTHVKAGLKGSIKDHYAGDNSTDTVSVTWNVVMMGRACCGVDNSTDFHNASKWVKTFSGYTLQTPLVCCKTFPSTTNMNSFQCATNPDSSTSNYAQGCYDSLCKFVDENRVVIIGVTVGILFFQLLLIIFAAVIVKGENQKVDRVV